MHRWVCSDKDMKKFISLLFIFFLTLCGCIGYNSEIISQKFLTATQNCQNVNLPAVNPPSHVDSPMAGFNGDMTYLGGRVIDGQANVYLVFWIDGTFQTASPLFVNLTKQFVQDFGQSPLYAAVSQYHDSQNRRPTCAILTGTFIDTRPFPANLVAAWKNGDGDHYYTGNNKGTLWDTLWRNELADIAAQQGWNTQDYHNLFVLLPTISLGPCGYHDYLEVAGQQGSPWSYVSYPYDKSQGQEYCADAPQSPNNDPTADITVDTLSHELSEAVSDPMVDGWKDRRGNEVADKCQLIPPTTIDPKTHGNVTWQGHTYIIQEEYDNLRHGCVVSGP